MIISVSCTVADPGWAEGAISDKKDGTEGSRIDFMFLGPSPTRPPDPLLLHYSTNFCRRCIYVLPWFSFCFTATDTVFTSRFRLTVTVCLLAYQDTRSEEYAAFVNSISDGVSTECCLSSMPHNTYRESASEYIKSLQCYKFTKRCSHLLNTLT